MIQSIHLAPIAAHPAVIKPNVKNNKMHFVHDKIPAKKCSHRSCTQIFKHIKKILSSILKKIGECFNRIHPKKKDEPKKPGAQKAVHKLIANQANDKKPAPENHPTEPFNFELLPKELQKVLIGDFFCGQSLLNFSQTNKHFHEQLTTEFQDNLEIAKLEREAFFKWQEYVDQIEKKGYGGTPNKNIFTSDLMSSYAEEIVTLENIIKVIPYTNLNYAAPFPIDGLLILIQAFKKIYPNQCEELKKALIKEIQSAKKKPMAEEDIAYRVLPPIILSLIALDPSQLFQLQDELGFHDDNYMDYYPSYITYIIRVVRDECYEETLNFVNSIPTRFLKVRGLTELLPVCHEYGKDEAALLMQNTRNLAIEGNQVNDYFMKKLLLAYLKIEDWKSAFDVIQYKKYDAPFLAKRFSTIHTKLNWDKQQLDLFLKKILTEFGKEEESIWIAVAYAYLSIDQKVTKKMIEEIDLNQIKYPHGYSLLTLAKIYAHLSDIEAVKQTIQRIEELYPLNSPTNMDVNEKRTTTRAWFLIEIADSLKENHLDFAREIWDNHIYSFVDQSLFLLNYDNILRRSLFQQQAETCQTDAQKVFKRYFKDDLEPFKYLLRNRDSFFWMRFFTLVDEDKAKTFLQTQGSSVLDHPLMEAQAFLGMADAIRFKKTPFLAPKGVNVHKDLNHPGDLKPEA